MTHRTILIHRGGYGFAHRLGSIEVRPEGVHHGYERFHVRLSIAGDNCRDSASVTAERLEEIIAQYTATACLKETYTEACARRKREAERKSARRRRKASHHR